MNKYLIIILLLPALFPLWAAAQTTPAPVKYEAVVEVPGADKAELYRRARRFFVEHFRDANEVLQTQDEAAGELVGKGLFKYNSTIHQGSATSNGVILFMLSLYIKDGRYKYLVDNLIHESDAGSFNNFSMIYDTPSPMNCEFCKRNKYKSTQKWCSEVWTDIKTQADVGAQATINELKAAMQKPAAGGGDW